MLFDTATQKPRELPRVTLEDILVEELLDDEVEKKKKKRSKKKEKEELVDYSSKGFELKSAKKMRQIAMLLAK